ncbi:glycosyltransferase family 15 protein [Phlebiopsis gigantea 11061_1 CR5-6]|uniref:Glycosyltransferase family 15 protein n=1 Tax=Phlebiopsis gigantea (strain 11061_1 CR5-6) TaxID=745531 RepID=A0A0C3S7C5_PHLG1|nr:glycosyltransferase family 15 protein [Phlebiopsis gigantea 11061_1 CR5-6]
MHTAARYLILVLVVVFALHSILSFTHEGYGEATSLSKIASKIPWGNKEYPIPGADIAVGGPVSSPTTGTAASPLERRANATILMLARNSDVDSAIRSVRELEDKFNSKFQYPWTFLNEEPFSDEFKTRVSNVISGPVEFGLIPREHWYQPEWVDEAKATAGRDKMVQDNIIYGGSVSYRNMCRFNSGFFFRHPIVERYRWYWRVEPDVHFHCDTSYDPFLYMEDNNKVYGFTITMYEYHATIPSLWDTVKKFTAENPQYVVEGNAMNYMSDDGGKSYNLCHFWSNFEIADMDFWRSEAYMKYFEYLDQTGGFYYERWGDAPVHSIGAALFAKKEQIHFFDDIGYEHNPYTHCPKGAGLWKHGHCSCNPERSFDYDGYSCMRQWDRIWQ